jgi:regulator of nucleoside diphosphate kinase
MNIRYHTFGFELTDALRQHTEWRVWQGLRHFASRVVSATVRLDDINGTRGGADKRCSMVVTLARRGTIVGRAIHVDMYTAIDKAAERVRIAAQRALRRRNPRESRAAHFAGWRAPGSSAPLRRFPARLDDHLHMPHQGGTLMAIKPIADHIALTTPDVDRLQAVCDSPVYRTSHAVFQEELSAGLRKASVVPAEAIPPDRVTMRSRVLLRDLATGNFESFTLVYPEEADIDNGRLSVLTPLGSALIGARRGATIRVHAAAGVRRIKIEKILYQPESAGDLDL